MTIKKSLIATAVAGALAIPMAAQAGGYGRLAIGINMPNEDAAATKANPTGKGLDDIAVQDVSSYFGIRGEDDLGNGMTAFFDYQWDIDGANGNFKDGTHRQSHIGLRGDFGTVKIGTMSEAAYKHVGVLTDWGWIVAANTWYTIGGGVYSRESIDYSGGNGPFTFGVTLDTDNDDGDATNDSENFDRMLLGATFDFGQGTVSFSHQSESNATGPEPALTGIGATFDLGEVGLRGAYYMGDNDTPNPVDSDGDPIAQGADPSGFDLLAHTSFGNGLSGFVLLGMLDSDTNDDSGDRTTFGVNLTKSLSSRTSLYAELLSETIDGGPGGQDLDPQTISLGAIHTF